VAVKSRAESSDGALAEAELNRRYGTPPAAPSVTLYINGSEESRRVFQMLESADIDFRAVASRRQTATITLHGRRYSGEAGARRLIDFLNELESAWREAVNRSMPALFEISEPAALERVRRHRARWREEARAVIAQVQAAEVADEQSAPRPRTMHR